MTGEASSVLSMLLPMDESGTTWKVHELAGADEHSIKLRDSQNWSQI